MMLRSSSSLQWLAGSLVALAAAGAARGQTSHPASLPSSESSGEAAQPVTLHGRGWDVSIMPQTLATTALLRDGRKVCLSAGQSGLGQVGNPRMTADQADWDLPDRGLSVHLGVTAAELAIEIRSSKVGEFTWPIVGLTEPVRALIWPHWEGHYIPLDDPQWRTFLASQEWDTLEGLSMPFWGLHLGDASLTFIATNRFNNTIRFEFTSPGPRASFTHQFPASSREWVYGFVIRLSADASPIEPARVFRQWLTQHGEFVTMRDKLKRVPRVERLLGAVQVYLWGEDLFTRHDVKREKWQAFCAAIIEQAGSEQPSVGKRLRALLNAEEWQSIEEISKLDWPYDYVKSQVAAAVSRLLERDDFYEPAAWKSVSLPEEARTLVAGRADSRAVAQRRRLNALLLQAAYPDCLLPVDEWGDGVSLKMLRALKEAGLQRVRLCVGGWEGIERRPEVAKAADEMGYLFGTYDSFHSIHDPALKGSEKTWTTAQFPPELYATGGIVRADGKKRGGFKQRGYLLSPQAARPYVERRVRENMARVPYSFYFIDCDAFGQVFDDYSPAHPSTQAKDAAARVERLAWIRDTFRVPIGSEGGSSYAAPVLHVAEGLLTPGIGWGDKDMKDKASKYYEGSYYPPDGPSVFFKPVPLKAEYERAYYDPRFQLPLNEIVFHDSFVSTHHWSSATLKYSNVRDTAALVEMLYQCPPLYHLNLDEWKKDRDWIVKHDAFFSPLHRETGLLPMTSFEWLTPDRQVQRTVFGEGIELIANFGDQAFTYHGVAVPKRSALAIRLAGGKAASYTP
jgi:hypothetical protein